jgi:dehydrogenase/reductase SDR family protein 12
MISLKEIITVERPLGECFDYVADFRSAAEWDATAFKARKTSDGPVGLESTFDVWCSLPLGSVKIEYRIVEFEPGSLVTLQAQCWLFEAVDTIHFRDRDGRTEIEYCADFSFRMPFAAAESLLRPGMERMGRASLEGLQRALADDFDAPESSPGTRRADRLVWPGLALFSKLGFRRGRKRWNPMSASLRGKRVVITGASSGLGLATARALADRGAELVLVMRNAEKAASVVSELKAESGNDAISCELADLSLMRDVDSLVEALERDGRAIDVLVNNAGALFNPRRETEEGLENSFALLLLSPYRLTLGLKPLLEKARGARVINVVSGGMYSQPLEVKKLQAREKNYSGSTAYARCKRALTVLTEVWAEEWSDEGIVVNAMHPGWADTPGVESALPAFHRLTRTILRSPEEGADTIIWLAAAREAGKVSGLLFLDREPRTTHLLAKTREAPGEREKLLEFLRNFEMPEPAAA